MAGTEQTLVLHVTDMPPKTVIKISRRDIKDMIRDELYAYQISWKGKPHPLIVIPLEEVKGLVDSIAKRATIGH